MVQIIFCIEKKKKVNYTYSLFSNHMNIYMLFHSNFWSFRNLNGKQLFRTSQLRADQTNSENKHSFSNHMFDSRLGHSIIIKGCEPILHSQWKSPSFPLLQVLQGFLSYDLRILHSPFSILQTQWESPRFPLLQGLQGFRPQSSEYSDTSIEM